MGNQITCPSCRAEFEITEVMEAQLSAQIRAEVELEVAAKRHNVAEREKSLAQLEKSLVEQKNQIEQEVLNLVSSERKKIAADARKQAEDDLRLQLDANDTELKHLRENLKTAERNELDQPHDPRGQFLSLINRIVAILQHQILDHQGNVLQSIDFRNGPFQILKWILQCQRNEGFANLRIHTVEAERKVDSGKPTRAIGLSGGSITGKSEGSVCFQSSACVRHQSD